MDSSIECFEHLSSKSVGFANFSKYFLDERVDLVCLRDKECEGGLYLSRLTKEVFRIDGVGQGDFWASLTFAAAIVSIARTCPSIPFVCRGSAGSSLLCFLVGISDVDPVAENFLLDRFLGGGRDRPPDIDLDFPSELRPVLWERVRQVYGDSIGFVATKLRYRSRGALREALRRCGISYDLWVSPLAVISSAQRERVLSLASSLEGSSYGLARHCGGIVYFPGLLSPPATYCSARERDPFVQLLLDKEDLEKAGLVKLDILSNNALSHLRAMGLEGSLGKDAEDVKTGRMFAQGDTWGIVQAESPAMRKVFANFGFATLQGVTLALGLVRPATGGGAGGSSYKPGAVGRNPLERRLIYEDDITEFLSVVLGSNPSLAEFSRRTLVKGGSEAKKLLEDMERIVKRKGRDKIFFRGQSWSWAQIKRQLGLASSYAFCKAHATAYGRIVWALGLAKISNPELFWSTFVSTAMPSSMYLPWVHFERIKAQLGVAVVWPGDLGLPVGRFFSYPWGVYQGRFMPSISAETITTFGEDWGGSSDMWLRQLKSAGFWAGKSGPILRTYLDFYGKAGFNFYALRALKAPRYHPLDKRRVCLFETLGYGSLKVLEYSKVCENGGVGLVPAAQTSPFVSVRGEGKCRQSGNFCYLSSF